MSKHLIKREDNIMHGTISWVHDGKDNQYCEAGEVVAIDWQPSAGWGLQEAHYTDEDGTVVPIDIEVREFTMPAKAIVIGATFKRFVAQDWTQGHVDVTDTEIEANVVTDFGAISSDPVTFTLGASGENGYDHYFIVFETGATAPTITWPADIRAWVGGSAPVIAANTHYEVSILDGIAAYLEAALS